jgi:hypothetical protein
MDIALTLLFTLQASLNQGEPALIVKDCKYLISKTKFFFMVVSAFMVSRDHPVMDTSAFILWAETVSTSAQLIF